jgi:hypothetical protein
VRRPALAALGVAALGAVPAIATAATFHAALWNNARGTITCGVGTVPPDTQAFLCGGGWKGGYAALGRTGRARKVVIKHHEPFGGTPPGAMLRAGTTWSLDGVRCTIATSTVTCRNRSGHGFTVSATKYRAF